MNSIFRICRLVLVLIGSSGCGLSDLFDPTASVNTDSSYEDSSHENVALDPPGTVSVNLMRPSGGAWVIDFESGAVGGAATWTWGDLALDESVNFTTTIQVAGHGTPAIVGWGPATGVSDIAGMLDSGWAQNMAATSGNGYIVVSQEGNAWRFVVDRYITSADNGGILGVALRWALLERDVRINSPIPLTLTAAPQQVTVSWTPLADVLSYTLHYYSIAGTTMTGQGNPMAVPVPVTDLRDSPYIHKELPSGRIYYYFLTATYPWGKTALPVQTEWTDQILVP